MPQTHGPAGWPRAVDGAAADGNPHPWSRIFRRRIHQERGPIRRPDGLGRQAAVRVSPRRVRPDRRWIRQRGSSDAGVGERPEEDLFLRVEYDGEIATNGATFAQARQDFAVLSGTRQSRELMESFLKTEHGADASLEAALKSALDAWSIGHMSLQTTDAKELPERAAVSKYLQEQLAHTGIEAGILERDKSRAIRYRSLSDKELRPLISD